MQNTNSNVYQQRRFGARLLDDPTFRQLQQQVEQPHAFNIFEAVGVTRQELRHSTFLAALLDQRYPHGLGDGFARALLAELPHEVLQSASAGTPRSAAELRLDPLHVRREWQNIDILLESPADRLVVIVENKIWTGEHDDQLARYLSIVERHYRDWTIVPLFLTPDGIPPSHPRYHLLDYNRIIGLLERLILINNQIDPAARLTLDHYIRMLRRHIVLDADSETARLARRLYNDHEDLIATLIRQREQRQQMIRTVIDGLVQSTDSRLRADQKNINDAWWYSRFAPASWYDARHLLVSKWTSSRLVVMFQLMHTPQQIAINLAVGPDTTGGSIRARLYELGQNHGPPFSAAEGLHEKFFEIYRRTVLGPETLFFSEYTDAQIRQALTAAWGEFVNNDLLAIERVMARTILSS